MRAAKKDSNHAELRDKFRDLGGTWLNIEATHGGEPDALLGWRGMNRLVEIKRPTAAKARKRMPKQVKFRETWRGAPVYQVETFMDIFRLFTGVMDSGARTSASSSGS